MAKPRRRKPPEVIADHGVIAIPLTQGLTAYVSEADLPLVQDHVWYAERRGHTFYARATIGGTRVYLHDLVMKPPRGMEVDHLDGCGTWNVRENLRVCTHQENLQNSRRCHGLACLRETVVLPDIE